VRRALGALDRGAHHAHRAHGHVDVAKVALYVGFRHHLFSFFLAQWWFFLHDANLKLIKNKN
jgi:hypothetical protein